MERRELYLELLPEVQDSHGFVDMEKCDSLLHTGLLVAGKVQGVDLTAARNEDGQWFRRPLDLPECLKVSESRSTISRDMLLGLMLALWRSRDLDMAESLWSYGEEHNWRMGDHDGSLEGASRVYLSPNLQGTLARMIVAMGGTRYWQASLPISWSASETGFRAHLDLIHILLEKDLGNKTGINFQETIRGYATRLPENAIAQYLAGNFSLAENLLLRDFPAGRLPTTADHCNPLRYETETAGEPCSVAGEGKLLSPTHYLLVSSYLLRL